MEPRPPQRQSDGDTVLFAPEASPEGCASGECLPEAASTEQAQRPAPVAQRPATAPGPAPAAAVSVRDEDTWFKAVEFVRDQSSRHGKSLSHARFLGFGEGRVRIAYPQNAGFHRSTVFGSGRALVEEALSKALMREVRLEEETDRSVSENAAPSIAEVEQSAQQARADSIEARARALPAVRNVLSILGGTIEHVQVLEAPLPGQQPAGADDDVEPSTEEENAV